MQATKITLILTFMGVLALYQFLYYENIFNKFSSLPTPRPNRETTATESKNISFYARLTSGGILVDNMEKWLLRSMKLFFLKKYLKLILVLDNEKEEDHTYGDKFANFHPEISVKVCYMDPYADNVDYGWGKARQYLDMMYADRCATDDYVAFIDVDTVFTTAVTDDLLFENNKPILIPNYGHPRFRCWIQSAQHILQVTQVFQCMSSFPVIFKVSHIVEMRQYVEKIHRKSFDHVFKEAAPDGCEKTGGAGSWCHFSIMCNYMWYHHRDQYAWHVQGIPYDTFKRKYAIPAMVKPEYFYHVVRERHKIPKPRPACHARYLFYEGQNHRGFNPDPKWVNFYLREGLCRSFGFVLCPEMCLIFQKSDLQEILFRFEHFNWLWDKRCNSTQQHHYSIVAGIQNRHPQLFNLNLKNKDEFCSLLREFDFPSADHADRYLR